MGKVGDQGVEDVEAVLGVGGTGVEGEEGEGEADAEGEADVEGEADAGDVEAGAVVVGHLKFGRRTEDELGRGGSQILTTRLGEYLLDHLGVHLNVDQEWLVDYQFQGPSGPKTERCSQWPPQSFYWPVPPHHCCT
jgi:hypothetical protein